VLIPVYIDNVFDCDGKRVSYTSQVNWHVLLVVRLQCHVVSTTILVAIGSSTATIGSNLKLTCNHGDLSVLLAKACPGHYARAKLRVEPYGTAVSIRSDPEPKRPHRATLAQPRSGKRGGLDLLSKLREQLVTVVRRGLGSSGGSGGRFH